MPTLAVQHQRAQYSQTDSTMSAFCAPLPVLNHRLVHRCPKSHTPTCRLPTPEAKAPVSSLSRSSGRPLRPYLEQLQRGEDLGEHAGTAVSVLVDGLQSGNVSNAEAGAFLVLQPPSRVSSATLSSIAAMLRSRMLRANISLPLLDIVGTGGDGMNTVNISTCAAIVAAGAGCRIAKSGNRSASSKSGSADVLEALGVTLGVSDKFLNRCVDEAGIGFLFAPRHHPALAAVAGVRKDLGMKSVFNILGPLVHPVPARRVVLGVYDSALIPPIASALAALDVERAMVVHCAGLDEFCPVGDAQVMQVRDGKVVGDVETVDTRVGGIQRCTMENLVGGDAEFNANAIRDVLDGKESSVADAVLLNAGAGCVVYGRAETLEEGVLLARRAIESGKAKEALRKWVAASKADED